MTFEKQKKQLFGLMEQASSEPLRGFRIHKRVKEEMSNQGLNILNIEFVFRGYKGRDVPKTPENENKVNMAIGLYKTFVNQAINNIKVNYDTF